MLIVLVPWSAANLHDILWPTGYRAWSGAEPMQHLKALAHNVQVISDEPGFVYRANLSYADAA